MATQITDSYAVPTNPAYGPTMGKNYYVPGREDVAVPGGAIDNALAAGQAVINGTNYAGLNQYMQRYAEYFDPFIQKDTIANPNWWKDRIARGAFPFFRGLTAETRIFRGGLPHFAGLSDWNVITDNPADGVCGADDYRTYSYAWERLTWYGYRRTWGSEPICIRTLMYTPDAQQQLAWILQTGADFGRSIQEAWNRDMYVNQSVTRDRGYIMSQTFNGAPGSAQYYYNPFLRAANVSDPTAKAALTAGKPFIVLPAMEVEPLNFDALDLAHQMLSVDAANSAVSNSGGQKIFGLPISVRDFRQFVLGNEYHLTNWREARPEKLIEGYDLGVKEFNGYAIWDDSNQLRFKIAKYIASYDSSAFGDLGSDLDGQAVYLAVHVPPLVGNTSRGENNTPVPEANPEYFKAELAIAPIFMNNVFANYFETQTPTSLGSQTTFGPTPGLQGNWSWSNILTPENRYGTTGQFIGEFRIHPKPGMSVFKATSFLYRRCTESLKSLCPVNNTSASPGSAAAAKVLSVNGIALSGATAAAKATAAAAANANGFYAEATLSNQLLGVGIGTSVSVEIGGQAFLGTVIESSGSSKYGIWFFAAGVSAPDAEGTGFGFCEDDSDPAVGKLCSWTAVLDSEASGSDDVFDVTYTPLVVVPATDDATVV